MCWYTSEVIKPIVAKRDKTVYKVMLLHEDGTLESPYRKTEFGFDLTYVEDAFDSEIGYVFKKYGYHSYDPHKTRIKIISGIVFITHLSFLANLFGSHFLKLGNIDRTSKIFIHS